jgi:hypothetical protein
MAIWDWFIGTPKVVEAVTDAATAVVKTGTSMLDNAFYTDQEKAENQQKMIGVWLKLQELLANDSGVSAIARRAVAFLVTCTFCGILLFAVAIWKFNKEWAQFALDVATKTYLGEAFLAVMIFFFGMYAFGKYTKWGTTSVLPKEECKPE